jgi:hypothetical protein
MFFRVLASTWIIFKICDNLKNKIQVFENKWNVFASIWLFFKHLNINVVNIDFIYL